jgi:hypothetical protein
VSNLHGKVKIDKTIILRINGEIFFTTQKLEENATGKNGEVKESGLDTLRIN